MSWLKDLRDKQYVDWHYDATNFIAKSQPAIYCLALNGIRYLRELVAIRAKSLGSDTKSLATRKFLLIGVCGLLHCAEDKERR